MFKHNNLIAAMLPEASWNYYSSRVEEIKQDHLRNVRDSNNEENGIYTRTREEVEFEQAQKIRSWWLVFATGLHDYTCDEIEEKALAAFHDAEVQDSIEKNISLFAWAAEQSDPNPEPIER